jgi:hypothetical protein
MDLRKFYMKFSRAVLRKPCEKFLDPTPTKIKLEAADGVSASGCWPRSALSEDMSC